MFNDECKKKHKRTQKQNKKCSLQSHDKRIRQIGMFKGCRDNVGLSFRPKNCEFINLVNIATEHAIEE